MTLFHQKGGFSLEAFKVSLSGLGLAPKEDTNALVSWELSCQVVEGYYHLEADDSGPAENCIIPAVVFYDHKVNLGRRFEFSVTEGDGQGDASFREDGVAAELVKFTGEGF